MIKTNKKIYTELVKNNIIGQLGYGKFTGLMI